MLLPGRVSYRLKRFLLALGAVALLFLIDTAYEAINTLRQLDVVEAERDTWQRPSDIIAALDLKLGNKVVDLGCGSGYFALKLSSAVGAGGTVYAVDVRRLPLMFLWARSVGKGRPNIKSVLGETDDPRLPAGVADAALIANTYHELQDPNAILDKTFQSLVSGGRLLIVDPSKTEKGDNPSVEAAYQLRRHGFAIVRREDSWIDQPGRGAWWLILARKP